MALLNDSLDLFMKDHNSYMEIWNVEKSLDLTGWRQFFIENPWYCIYIVFANFAVLQLGERLMKNRSPFELKTALAVWNFCLAAFSGIVFLRTLPELLHILTQDNAFHESVCSRNYFNYATVFWGLMYVFSKIVELGDLTFLVLKKKPLTLRNWLHHNSVMIGAWLGYPDFTAAWRWLVVMNVLVHFMVYSYLTLKAIDFSTPKAVPMAIEIAQMVQMLIGSIVSGYSLYVYASGGDCILVFWHTGILCFGFMLLLRMYWKHFSRQYLRQITVKLE